jgi:hypothetical protein
MNIMQSEYEQIIQSMRSIDSETIADGAVELDRYIQAKIKILWVLRETNGGGSWDLRDFLKQPFSYNKWHSTFGSVAKISHCLLNNIKPEDLNFDAKSVVKALKYIAVININKKGGGSRIGPSYELHSKRFVDIIQSQIQLLSPELIIAAGTLDKLPMYAQYKDNLGNAPFGAVQLSDNQWLVKSYHTAQISISVPHMYETMLSALKKSNWDKIG